MTPAPAAPRERGAAEEAEPYGNGSPGLWLLVVAWELAFIGLCVWLHVSQPMWGMR